MGFLFIQLIFPKTGKYKGPFNSFSYCVKYLRRLILSREIIVNLSRLDSVGGELNAYTTKEETCVYASFPQEYLNRSVELLSDVIFNSNFPAQELKKEKEVVIDEINSYKDYIPMLVWLE